MKEEVSRTRPESTRPKMPRSQRAKQFAPFDALTGLMAVLKDAEEEHSRQLESSKAVHVSLDEEDQ